MSILGRAVLCFALLQLRCGAAAICNGFCSAKPQPWKTRCGWSGCGGCSQCTTPPPSPPSDLPEAVEEAPPANGECRRYCATHTFGFPKLCGRDACKGCGQCSGPAPSPSPTPTPATEGAPSPLACAAYCTFLTHTWAGKCAWVMCSECEPCGQLVIAPPPPLPPPPLPPPSPPAIDGFPAEGALILAGGDGVRGSEGCVHEPDATHFSGVPIAGQCCTREGNCKRSTSRSNDGCLFGAFGTPAYRQTTWIEAARKCESEGLVLCDKGCENTGCGYHAVWVWTRRRCPIPPPQSPPSQPPPPSPRPPPSPSPLPCSPAPPALEDFEVKLGLTAELVDESRGGRFAKLVKLLPAVNKELRYLGTAPLNSSPSRFLSSL